TTDAQGNNETQSMGADGSFSDSTTDAQGNNETQTLGADGSFSDSTTDAQGNNETQSLGADGSFSDSTTDAQGNNETQTLGADGSYSDSVTTASGNSETQTLGADGSYSDSVTAPDGLQSDASPTSVANVSSAASSIAADQPGADAPLTEVASSATNPAPDSSGIGIADPSMVQPINSTTASLASADAGTPDNGPAQPTGTVRDDAGAADVTAPPPPASGATPAQPAEAQPVSLDSPDNTLAETESAAAAMPIPLPVSSQAIGAGTPDNGVSVIAPTSTVASSSSSIDDSDYSGNPLDSVPSNSRPTSQDPDAPPSADDSRDQFAGGAGMSMMGGGSLSGSYAQDDLSSGGGNLQGEAMMGALAASYMATPPAGSDASGDGEYSSAAPAWSSAAPGQARSVSLDRSSSKSAPATPTMSAASSSGSSFTASDSGPTDNGSTSSISSSSSIGSNSGQSSAGSAAASSGQSESSSEAHASGNSHQSGSNPQHTADQQVRGHAAEQHKHHFHGKVKGLKSRSLRSSGPKKKKDDKEEKRRRKSRFLLYQQMAAYRRMLAAPPSAEEQAEGSEEQIEA
ncbi:MAG: hypothetical protein ACYCW6_29080, partial [Candidatus Xenobia bacterium]